MASTDWRKHTLKNGKEIKLCMTAEEIKTSYNEAKYKGDQITVLADLNSVSVQDMSFYLLELGFDNSYIRQRTEQAKKKKPSAPKQTPKKKTTPEKEEMTPHDSRGDSAHTKLLDDTLALISEYEDAYRYCSLLVERLQGNMVRLRQSIDSLTTVYKNVEGMNYGK